MKIKMDIVDKRKSYLWLAILILYFIYYSQGTLYPSGSIVSQACFFIILASGAICCCKVIYSFKTLPVTLIASLFLVILLGISYILSPKEVYSIKDSMNLRTLDQFKNQILFLLSIFTGFYIGLHKDIPYKQILWMTVLFFILAIYMYITNNMKMVLIKGEGYVTNNDAYTFIYLFPYLALTLKRSPAFSIFAFIISFMFVIAGVKRGAILCFAVCIIYFIYWLYKNNKINFKTLIFLGIITIVGAVYIQYVLENTFLLEMRMRKTMAGDTSERDNMYPLLFQHWLYDTPFINMIFGSGSAYTIEVCGNYAHQDWLELLIDLGIIGFLIYAVIFIAAYKYIRRFPISSVYHLSAVLILLVWFVKSMFSMGLDSMVGAIDMILLGYLMSKIYRDKILDNQRIEKLSSRSEQVNYHI